MATVEPLPNWTVALTLTSLLHSVALTTLLPPRPWRMEGNGGTAIPDWTAAIYQSVRGNPEEGTSKSSRKPFLFNNVGHDCLVTTDPCSVHPIVSRFIDWVAGHTVWITALKWGAMSFKKWGGATLCQRACATDCIQIDMYTTGVDPKIPVYCSCT